MYERTGKIEVNRIDELLPTFEGDAGIDLVFLFGSYASGGANALSDVDLALVLASSVPRKDYLDYRINYLSLAAKALRDDRVDVIILNTAPPLLAHQAIRGRLLFERSAQARVKYIVQVQRMYLDLKHFYTIDSEYLRQRLKEGTFGQP